MVTGKDTIMRNFGKYGKTFGFIFGAAFLMSGVNSLVVSNTGAPSIATYNITQDVAKRIVGAFSVAQVSGLATKTLETGIVMAGNRPDVLAGS
jgi:hypothetical protein